MLNSSRSSVRARIYKLFLLLNSASSHGLLSVPPLCVTRYLLKEQELWASERSRLTADQERLIGERDQAMVDSSRDASAEQLRLNQLMQERETLLAQHQALQTDNDRVREPWHWHGIGRGPELATCHCFGGRDLAYFL